MTRRREFGHHPKLNLKWLEEKLAKPEEWSVRERDDMVFFMEKKREELSRTPNHHQPLRMGREEALERMEAAMEAHIVSQEQDSTRSLT